jgi:hypothetical protein
VGAAPGSDNGDDICAGSSEGVCRRTAAGSMGPHCANDIQRRCDSDADCGATDHCLTTQHGPPRPLASGGVGMCVVSTFAEDVVGTVDVASGASAVRVRDRVEIFPADASQPCPVCGGFCSGAANVAGPGTRTLCATDLDCAGDGHCVTDFVCSFGPSADRPCRPSAPFGGPTASFGNPSVDCAVPGSPIGVLDVLADPRDTDTRLLAPEHECADPAFTGGACIGGPNEGRACMLGIDCPAGTCADQCFCAGSARPSDCGAACVGGSADGAACTADTQCPSGFCHPGDCRPDASDTDSAQEGHCTTDPSRQCFVNAGILRQGSAGLPNRTSVAAGCIPATGSQPADVTAGLPAPFAITQPETAILVGF